MTKAHPYLFFPLKIAFSIFAVCYASAVSAESTSAGSPEERTSYYVKPKSYTTNNKTEPPPYVKQANKTWLKDYASFADVDWLDVGLEHRVRFEHRDNDFRRAQENIDDPIFLRTRAYLGVKNILDPLRLAIEMQDSRRNHSDYSREYSTSDINQLDILQAYAELNFKDSFLGKDDLGNARPIWVRLGRFTWDAIDRRLIARNAWRNTTNAFQGVRSQIGDTNNDWQLELFAGKPVQRFTTRADEADHALDFYAVIGNWRGWSEYVTLEPYYLLLEQDGDEVQYDSNGKAPKANAKNDREIHTAGLRAYGMAGKSGFDYDVNYAKQWGHQDQLNGAGAFVTELDHDAYAYTTEFGYRFKLPWKPRLSFFYGVASGDKNPNDDDNQRFDRLFGASRAWSNNNCIQTENIRSPKLRLEFEPKIAFLEKVKVDTAFSWYRLQSDTDRWNAGAKLQDKTGNSGDDLGKEFYVRVRFPINQYVSLNLGYAHFWAGDFVEEASRKVTGEADRDDSSDFLYSEITLLGF